MKTEISRRLPREYLCLYGFVKVCHDHEEIARSRLGRCGRDIDGLCQRASNPYCYLRELPS